MSCPAARSRAVDRIVAVFESVIRFIRFCMFKHEERSCRLMQLHSIVFVVLY